MRNVTIYLNGWLILSAMRLLESLELFVLLDKTVHVAVLLLIGISKLMCIPILIISAEVILDSLWLFE